MMGTALLHNRVMGDSNKASEVLNDNDWKTISKVSAKGQAQNYWAVGDTKKITINGKVGNTTFSNMSVWAFILGFDHNRAIEGSNTIHFQIGKNAQTSGTNICLVDSQYDNAASSAGYFNMNTGGYFDSDGGWGDSNMRTAILGSNHTPSSPLSGSMMAALPSDLRGVMKGVTKYSDNTGSGVNSAAYVTATTDYLWLLAEYEVFGSRTLANSAEQNYQEQYTFYSNGNSKVFYRHTSTSNTAYWWLRSVAGNATAWVCVTRNGGQQQGSPNISYGVAPAFCV